MTRRQKKLSETFDWGFYEGLIIVVILVALVGCLKPIKPKVEMGIVDYTANEIIAGITGQGSNTITFRVPISQYDKATCFKPKEWSIVSTYLHDMESYVSYLESHCKIK